MILLIIINVEINDEKRKIEIPQENLTKKEAAKKLYNMIAFGKMFTVGYVNDTVFCFPEESKDIQGIEEILKEVQSNGFPY